MRLSDHTANYDSYFKQLKDLYARMSDTYNQVAAQYEFGCEDCPENCCQTRFYNFTYSEYFFLMEGMAGLGTETQKELIQKAVDDCHEIAAIESRGESPRVMCPLNEDGMCTLYEFRPMICRLHGIPYDLQLPDRNPVRGEGCTEFDQRTHSTSYIPFDRTPLYRTLSALERDVRLEIGESRKIKMTVAEMIAYNKGDVVDKLHKLRRKTTL